MNPTLATLLTISVTVIAAILVLVLIFFIPVLLQVRRTAHEAEKLIDKDPGWGSPWEFGASYCLQCWCSRIFPPSLLPNPHHAAEST